MDRNKITSELLEKAFKLKWESEILKEDFAAWLRVPLNRLYPRYWRPV